MTITLDVPLEFTHAKDSSRQSGRLKESTSRKGAYYIENSLYHLGQSYRRREEHQQKKKVSKSTCTILYWEPKGFEAPYRLDTNIQYKVESRLHLVYASTGFDAKTSTTSRSNTSTLGNAKDGPTSKISAKLFTCPSRSISPSSGSCR